MADANVPLIIENVLMLADGQPVVLLSERKDDGHGERVIQMFIDQTQALNIQLALEGQLPPRPMTHDLFSQVLNELGGIVERVVIEDVQRGTFYASLYISVERDGKTDVKRFDARPSDCLALAIRVGARIEVTRAVYEAEGKLRSENRFHVKDDESGDLGVPR